MKRYTGKILLLTATVAVALILCAIGAAAAFAPDYCFFTAQDGDATITVKKCGDPDDLRLEYSFDNTASGWKPFDPARGVVVPSGKTVYFRAAGAAERIGKNSFDYWQFAMTTKGTVKGGGNLMSLLDPACKKSSLLENGGTDDGEYAFYRLFADCAKLTSAPALPADGLAKYCYAGTFSGCTALSKAPALPSATVAEYCYQDTFKGCTALTSAPALPAAEMAKGCYKGMFAGCTALAKAPKLPSVSLKENCYESMFVDCKALTVAPRLPATELKDGCYRSMFADCTALVRAAALYTDGGSATTDMFSGIATTGVLYNGTGDPDDAIPLSWSTSATPTYEIVLVPSVFGTVEIADWATVGETVTLTGDVGRGNTLKGVSVQPDGGARTDAEKVRGKTYSFTVSALTGADTVTVSPDFRAGTLFGQISVFSILAAALAAAVLAVIRLFKK